MRWHEVKDHIKDLIHKNVQIMQITPCLAMQVNGTTDVGIVFHRLVPAVSLKGNKHQSTRCLDRFQYIYFRSAAWGVSQVNFDPQLEKRGPDVWPKSGQKKCKQKSGKNKTGKKLKQINEKMWKKCIYVYPVVFSNSVYPVFKWNNMETRFHPKCPC